MTQDPVAQIRSRRREGDLTGALETVLACQYASDLPSIWGRHFCDPLSGCLLLDFARDTRSNVALRERMLNRLEDETSDDHRPIGSWLTGSPELKALILARIATIHGKLDQAAKRYAKIWPVDGQSPVTTYASQLESDETIEQLDCPAHVQRFVGDMLRYARGEQLVHDAWVTTWILFVDKQLRVGRLGQLRLERVPGGSGLLYPHPRFAGYGRWTTVFQQAWSNAWRYVFRDEQPGFNVRWSIHVEQDPLAEWDDRSGEAAFACALCALRNGEWMDQHLAITAKLANPDSKDGRLDSVGSVDEKLLAELRPKQIDEVFVAEGQPELATIGEGRIKLVPVETLDAACEEMTKWGSMTRRAREAIALQAATQRDEECDGRYIPSALAVPDPAGEPRGLKPDAANLESDPPESEPLLKLSDDVEAPAVMLGRWPFAEGSRLAPKNPLQTPRIQLVADSGLGKTTLLIDAEHRIAAEPEGRRVPIRLTDLSDSDWRSVDSVVKRIATTFKNRFLPDNSAEEIATWIRDRIIGKGDAVFLLDALDQTTNYDGLKNFMSPDGEAASCPILLTMRPHILDSDSTTFQAAEWLEVRVRPFDKPRIRKYLGEELSIILLDRNVRYEQSKDLLSVPLLLKFMRRLAEQDEIDTLRNRFALYERAVEELVARGKQSLESTKYKDQLLGDTAAVEQILAPIAWRMVIARVDGRFTGAVTGRAFAAIREDVSIDDLKAITQVNLTTFGSLLDRPNEKRFAFRHLSFCEYYAALALAASYPLAPHDCEGAVEPSDPFTLAVARRARQGNWSWIFRFALARLDDEANDEATPDEQRSLARQRSNALATDLMRHGNPFLVADAIHFDGVLLENLQPLIDWLVHRSRNYETNLSKERVLLIRDKRPTPRPSLSEADWRTVSAMFHPWVRDSRYLHAAWELVSENTSSAAAKIRRDFLSEYPTLIEAADSVAVAFDQSFQRIPPSPSDGFTFPMVATERPKRQHVRQPVRVGGQTGHQCPLGAIRTNAHSRPAYVGRIKRCLLVPSVDFLRMARRNAPLADESGMGVCLPSGLDWRLLPYSCIGWFDPQLGGLPTSG